MFHVPEEYRYQHPNMPSKKGDPFGCFNIPIQTYDLFVIATDGKEGGDGWEHVSVSMPRRTPTWEQMCKIKDLFWDEEDVVVQFHPRKSEYVNVHEHCLHLWRHPEKEFPTPDKKFVG